jgi:hypothetical protein
MPQHFLKNLRTEGSFWKTLRSIDQVNQLNKFIILADSITKKSPSHAKFLQNKEVVITFNPRNNNNYDLLTIIPIRSAAELETAEVYLSEYIKGKRYISSRRKYHKSNLVEARKNERSEVKFCYTIFSDLLIFSDKPHLIEESVRQLDLDQKEVDNELAPLLKSTNKQAEMNLFINHQIANEFILTPLSEILVAKTKNLKSYSDWTELDITLKEGKILFTGFTNGNMEKAHFSKILMSQHPGSSNIESILPLKTYSFSSYYLSDLDRFFTDYHEFLTQSNLFINREKRLKEIEKNTEINLRSLFTDIFDREVAEALISNDVDNQTLHRLFLIRTKSESYAQKKLLSFLEAYSKWDKEYNDVQGVEFRIDKETQFTLYKFPVQNLPYLLFGRLFPYAKTTWFTFYNNYLIFGESQIALQRTLMSNILGETLSSNANYQAFQSEINSKYNYYYFCNLPIALNHANLFFNSTLSAKLITDMNFRKFKYFSWQVSSTGDMTFNNGLLTHSAEINQKPKTVWQSHIGSEISKKPLIIENRFDSQSKEIIVCDSKNNLYKVNNIGRVVWKVNAESPILSDIQVLDLFNNGQYQLVFNTRSKLFILDSEGNHVENFPVKFNENATNGVSVFDYEDNKNYRFFIAHNDHHIYAYGTDGNQLEGWQPFKTDHEVTHPIQHFAIDGKDYIVASDKMKEYILDRRGNIRVPTDFVYSHSKNNPVFLETRSGTNEPRLVSTDMDGNIHRTYFNGRHEVVEFNKLNDNHFFVATSLDKDNETEYIFTQDKHIYVQKNTGRAIFNQRIECEISHKANVYNFSDNAKKIGITCKKSERIFLFDLNGSLHQGFPLEGCSEFSIGFISDDRSNFNLIVGGPNGYLYNYLVE